MLFEREQFGEYRKLKWSEVTGIMSGGMMMMVNNMSGPVKLKYTFRTK